MDTYSSIYNVLSYSDLMPDLVKTLNQEIEIDLKANTINKNIKAYDFDYLEEISNYNFAETLENYSYSTELGRSNRS